MNYKDNRGYKRRSKEPSNLVHRHRAYHHIYLKNRKKYPLPFGAYEVHHIDGDKNNNRMDNLAVLTPEEHDKVHDVLKKKEEDYIQKLTEKDKKNKGRLNWRAKKYSANSEDFAIIRLVLGHKVTDVLLLTIKLSFVISLVVFIIQCLLYERRFLPTFKIILLIPISILALSVGLILLSFIIGLFYNLIGNFVNVLKNLFRR